MTQILICARHGQALADNDGGTNLSPRKPRSARTEAGDSTPGGNYTQLFVDLIDAGNAQAQLILKAIAQHADWKSGVCHPKCRTLAEIAKCSPKTVRRYLAQLKVDGILDLDERFDDDSGRQTSNAITLVGYAEWACAIRSGGLVAAPKIVPKYDAPHGQSDHGAPGQVDQGGLDNLTTTGAGQSDQGAVDNLTRPPGQQVSTLNEPSLEPSREREGGSADFEQVLHGLRTGYPEYRRSIDRLIEPLLRRRELAKAPDPVFALAAVAKKAARLSDEILDAVVERVADERGCTFKPADVEKALKDAAAAMPSASASSKPTSPETSKLREVLREHFGEPVFSAWFAGITFVERADDGAAVVSVPDGFLRKYIEQHYASELLVSATGAFGVERVRLVVEGKP